MFVRSKRYDKSQCPVQCVHGDECFSGIAAFTQQHKYVSGILGSDAVDMGSDFNSPLVHLHPSCDLPSDVMDITKNGYWNIGQTPHLWTALEALGAPVSPSPHQTTERFFTA